MNKSSHYNVGIGAIFLYCIIYALSQVLTAHYEHSISPYLLATYIFLITTLCYVTLTSRQFDYILRTIRANVGLVIKLNISTALAWVTIIYALKYLDPAVALSISFGVLPLSTMMISYFNKQSINPTRVDFLLSLGVMAVIILIFWHTLYLDFG